MPMEHQSVGQEFIDPTYERDVADVKRKLTVRAAALARQQKFAKRMDVVDPILSRVQLGGWNVGSMASSSVGFTVGAYNAFRSGMGFGGYAKMAGLQALDAAIDAKTPAIAGYLNSQATPFKGAPGTPFAAARNNTIDALTSEAFVGGTLDYLLPANAMAAQLFVDQLDEAKAEAFALGISQEEIDRITFKAAPYLSQIEEAQDRNFRGLRGHFQNTVRQAIGI